MTRHATWIALGVVALIGGIGVFFLTRWQAQKVRARRMTFAAELLESDRAGEALELLIAENQPKNGEQRKRFGQLQVEALRKAGLIEQLRQLYYKSPEWFDDDEEAALLVARALLSTDDTTSLDRLLETWRSRGRMTPQWFILKVDRLLKNGDRRGAKELLASRKFNGKDDFGRLSRLALLNSDQPELAWEHLQQAFVADSTNPMLRLFRGNLLEAAGRRSEARVEYVAAFVAAPTEAGMCDQLAEFYRRCDNHFAAQATWGDLPVEHQTDFIHVKRLFWHKTAAPANKSVAESPSPPGPWRDFAEYMRALPEDQFWDETEFNRLKAAPSLLKLRQETYWLKLFQLVLDQRRGKATPADLRRHLVESRISTNKSYSNDLQRAMTLALSYQQNSSLNAASIVREPPRKLSRRHRFFDDLDAAHFQYSIEGDRYQTPTDLAALLRDENAFSVIAMAAGWTEAAVRLDTGAAISEHAPPWAAYGMTQAYRLNRGPEAALGYAARQAPTPLLKTLQGELCFATGDTARGHRLLSEVASLTSDIGVRAAWLSATAKIDEAKWEEAKRIVQSNRRFELSALGQETLAKIATLEGNDEEATAIYDKIVDESFEAAAHAARRAFAQSDWETAEQLTQKLLKQMPESIQLRRNLRAIDEAQRANEL